MKLNEIESWKKPRPIKMTDNIFSRIEKLCSDALPAIKETGYIFRGIDGMPTQFIGVSPENREPMGVAKDSHNALNVVLRRNGFIANRSNSIFCSGHPWVAQSYGNLYAIFPINGFHYTWSRTIKDLYFHEEEVNEFIENNSDDTVLKKYHFNKDAFLSSAIASEREIYIHGKYIALMCSRYKNELFDYFGWYVE